MFIHGTKNGRGAVLGTGVDIVENSRFEHWIRSSIKLDKIFTPQEIVNCLNEFENHEHSMLPEVLIARKTSYWAVRFAAKEAFYKALSAALVNLEITNKPFSLMFACKRIEVVKDAWNVPSFKVRWRLFEEKVGTKLPRLETHLSMAHEKMHSIASVIVSL